MHLWHPRPLTKKYYRHREVNLQHFIGHLKESFTINISSKYFDKSISSYVSFVENLQKKYGFEDEKYCGLATLNRITLSEKPKSSIKRKIRRRFLNILDRFR